MTLAVAVATESRRMAKRKTKPAKALSPLARDPASGVTVATMGDDRGTPERWQHGAFEDVRSDRGAATYRRAVDPAPLDQYRRRRMIDGRQWYAGDVLRQAWLAAGMTQRVTADYTLEVRDRRSPITFVVDAGKDAMMRYLVAMRAVGLVTPELAHVLLHVVCMEGTAGDWAAREKNQRGRYAEQAGMLLLRLALDALANHYRLPVDKPAR